jgi:hypothetical protein
VKFPPRQRWLILGGLLTATLAAAAWMHDNADEADSKVATVVQTAAGRATTPPRSASRHEPPQVSLDKLKSRRSGEVARDPFAVNVPHPKKPKPAAGAAPPGPVAVVPLPPSAPPLPFTYMGKLLSGQDTTIFLTQGERNLIVRQGDTIDSVYRVEHIADSGITLVYLPLDQRQTIFIGASP